MISETVGGMDAPDRCSLTSQTSFPFLLLLSPMMTLDLPTCHFLNGNYHFSPGGSDPGDSQFARWTDKKTEYQGGRWDVPSCWWQSRPACGPDSSCPMEGERGLKPRLLSHRPRWATAAPFHLALLPVCTHQRICISLQKPNIEACHHSRIATQDKAICMDSL